ncbi:MAG TPA: trimethylamine methyltransferase family protein [Spirochaetia bacterium]|nr:trimethylamine methyltransferase family protein [Spirochaetia bacterium]
MHMLTHTDIQRIDLAARSLLEDPGIMLEDEQIVDTLLKSGAKPGAKNMVVRMPKEMIDEYLALAPSEISFSDRRGESVRVTPDSASLFWTGAALFYLDSEGVRPIYRRDLADFTRIIDTLSNVHAIVGTSTEDTAPKSRDFTGFRIMAQNTRKHIRALSFTPKGGEAMIEMAKALLGGSPLKENPIFSIGFTAHGPLRWTNLALGVYKATAGYGIPATINGEPMAGASAPVTLAGNAAVGTAEILAGIVVNQILEPGRPCLFNLGFAHVMDMRKGFAVTGGPENGLMAVAGAELARHYGLPSVSWMCTDSLYYDGQNAMEKMLAAVTHAQARVSTVWGVGQAESEKTISPQQAVIDSEIIALVRRFLRSFKVEEQTLAVEEIRRVGINGSFLGSDHTFAHFRGEVYEPELLVREQRAGAGKLDNLTARAEDKVRRILAAPAEPLLEEQTERELLRIEERYSH